MVKCEVYDDTLCGPMALADVLQEVVRIRATTRARDPNQIEFIQAFDEIIESLIPLFVRERKYLSVARMIAEPERVVQFRVNWTDDNGIIQSNRGIRVQFNSAIGPYKGGLRLHPSVNLSILKFLGFEQIFKNSLTGLPMGGGKGGSDFNPKGKSNLEIRSFCQSFMTELSKHIGADTDIPAGDIGTGGREIGFMFGQYRRMANEFTGVLTGKGNSWGGSHLRPEATGYGAVYFAQHIVKDKGMTLEGKKCLVSGSGNAAQYTCEKLIQLGAVVLSVSDSSGTIVFEKGMTRAQLDTLLELKNKNYGRCSEMASKEQSIIYYEGEKPWRLVAGHIAFPAATQNEIDIEDAKAMVEQGLLAVIEVANMPTRTEAIHYFKDAGVVFGPGKAANAGGVAVSGMEMMQNSARRPWTFEETDAELEKVMEHIYTSCKSAAQEYGIPGDLQSGANIAGFLKVADAMIDQGLY